MGMKHYVKKIAISGAISAMFFAGFLYFVYDAESAKYDEKKATEPIKQYNESIIAQVNSEVAQAVAGLSAEGYAFAAPQPTQQQGAYAPIETTETLGYDEAEPQPQQTANISALEEYVAAAIPNALQIPSVTIPSIPAPTSIPNIAPITIPTIPSPQPAPAVQQAPAALIQPKPNATQPRTTVS